MKKSIITAIAVAVLGGLSAAAIAQGPGQCGKGMKWDAKDGKCVSSTPTSKGSSSGSGSGSGSGSAPKSAPKGKGSGSGSG